MTAIRHITVGLVFATTFMATGAASALIVTPGDVSPAAGSWRPANERDGGASAITGTMADRLGGNGSLEQTLPAPAANSPKTDFEIFSSDTTFAAGLGVQAPTGFGLLTELTEFSFDWQRLSSSTAPAHLTPATRLYVYDPDEGTNGSSHLLIWEGIYNGYPVSGGPAPTDAWTTEDATAENFWRIPQFLDGAFAGFGSCGTGVGQVECFVFDRGLNDWGFGPNSVVYGVNVGLGSGWSGSFAGFADLITLGFNNAQTEFWDFELTVPTTTTTTTTTVPATTTPATTTAPTTSVPPTTVVPTTATPATTTGPGGVLPETGSRTTTTAIWALSLLLLGATSLTIARRRPPPAIR